MDPNSSLCPTGDETLSQKSVSFPLNLLFPECGPRVNFGNGVDDNDGTSIQFLYLLIVKRRVGKLRFYKHRAKYDTNYIPLDSPLESRNLLIVLS